MNNLTTEQIREILEGAPEGEEHVNFPICGGLTHEVHRLDDLREILSLRQRVEDMRVQLQKLGYCTECGQVAQHHINEPLSSCSCGTGEDYAKRPLQELQVSKAQQSEVAARREAYIQALMDDEKIKSGRVLKSNITHYQYAANQRYPDKEDTCVTG